MNDTLGLSSYTDAQSMNFSVNRLEGTTGESVDHARFLLPPKKTFKTQYNAIYVQRLNAMRPKLVENINRAFANEGQSTQIPVCTRLVDAMPDEEVVIIGTTYKEMPDKPCVLDELEKDPELLLNQRSRSNFCSPKDVVFVEDEFGRIPLSFPNSPTPSFGCNIPFSVDTVVSGIVLGVQGVLNSSGEFIVSRAFYCGSGMDKQPTPPKSISTNSTTSQFLSNIGEDRNEYFALVSGLQVGETSPAALSLLFDLLSGLPGSTLDQHSISQISKLVIAGNSVVQPAKATGYAQRVERLIPGIENMRQFDFFLSQASSTMTTYLLPGATDPSNFLWPQQPLHSCLFPGANAFDSLIQTTNPTWIRSDDWSCLVSDGKNIQDICRFTSLSPLDALESTLKWGYIAPTAPDTLGVYPYLENDPFVLHHIPDIYAIGTQKEFECRTIIDQDTNRSTLAFTIPSFSLTGEFVLVNPITRHVVKLSIPLFKD